MFGFILGLWPTQSLVPDPLGNVADEPLLVAWVSVWASHRLAPFTRSEPPLPQHILQAELIVGQKFCSWVGVPVSPLEDLPAYRKWLVQIPYPHH